MILLLVALDPDSTPPIHQRITVAISSLCMPPQVCQFKIVRVPHCSFVHRVYDAHLLGKYALLYHFSLRENVGPS